MVHNDAPHAFNLASYQAAAGLLRKHSEQQCNRGAAVSQSVAQSVARCTFAPKQHLAKINSRVVVSTFGKIFFFLLSEIFFSSTFPNMPPAYF